MIQCSYVFLKVLTNIHSTNAPLFYYQRNFTLLSTLTNMNTYSEAMSLKDVWSRVLSIGLNESLSLAEQRQLKLLNGFAALSTATTLFFILLSLALGYSFMTLLTSCILVFGVLPVFWLNHRRFYVLSCSLFFWCPR